MRWGRSEQWEEWGSPTGGSRQSTGQVLRSLVLILALVVALGAPAIARADNSTPDGAQTLDVTAPSASSTLVGSRGGAYQYYRVGYQGGSAPVLFTLTYQPYWGSGNTTFGFNLYGPSGLTYAGQVTGTNGNAATAQLTLVNGAAMSVLVQVYNYSDGGAVAYTLAISGLSGGTASTIVGQANSTPDRAIAVSTIEASLGGTLMGSTAGAYHYYTLRYPGGNTSLAVTMNVTPVYTGSGQAFGFHLYRQIPNQPSTLTATGTVTAQDSYSETFSATISGQSASTYMLQVYNYWAGTPINYGVTATGLAGPAPLASGNGDADHAIVLNSAQPGATGTLVGNRGGAFQYYLVTYPGNNSAFALAITYPATGGASPSSLGFKVYDGANLVTTITPNDDGNGVLSGVWNYQNASAKTFGVQVFNYAQDLSANNVLYQIGAQ